VFPIDLVSVLATTPMQLSLADVSSGEIGFSIEARARARRRRSLARCLVARAPPARLASAAAGSLMAGTCAHSAAAADLA
jgi:hypothetical protein